MRRLIAAGLVGLLAGCSGVDLRAELEPPRIKPKTKYEKITELVIGAEGTQTGFTQGREGVPSMRVFYLGLGFKGVLMPKSAPEVCGKPLPGLESAKLGGIRYLDVHNDGWGKDDLIKAVIEYDEMGIAYDIMNDGDRDVMQAAPTKICTQSTITPGLYQHFEGVKDFIINRLRRVPRAKPIGEPSVDDGRLGLRLDRG